MQTLESLLSLMFFITILVLLFPVIEPKPIDDSLHRLQIAEDAWRILYLRGDFQDFSELQRPKVETDLATIGNETSLCFFIEGIQFTNCRSGDRHEILLSVSKTAIYNGAPKRFMFSVAK